VTNARDLLKTLDTSGHQHDAANGQFAASSGAPTTDASVPGMGGYQIDEKLLAQARDAGYSDDRLSELVELAQEFGTDPDEQIRASLAGEAEHGKPFTAPTTKPELHDFEQEILGHVAAGEMEPEVDVDEDEEYPIGS
jgi:hypothetical protein